VIGDCNPDVLVLGGAVTPAFGQAEQLVGDICLVVGGSAAIMAVAAARLGLSVELVAAVGADPAGEFMLAQLAAEGVGTGAVAVRKQAPTGMTVALSRGGDRAILTSLGAMTSLTCEDVPAALVSSARHVHASSYFLLERSLGPGLAAVLSAARAAGATTSLDTNWDPAGRWGDASLHAALAHTSLLLPNEAEALHLSGRAADRPTRALRRELNGGAADVAAAARALAALGPALVVKLGPRGALCVDGTHCHRVQLPPVTPVDATGAGDCFNAGLIAGLLGGLSLPEAAALGCAAGALSTRAAGGTASAPRLAEARTVAGMAAIE
jgi:sugar/nucleoside kinase (ribokinase family)